MEQPMETTSRGVAMLIRKHSLVVLFYQTKSVLNFFFQISIQERLPDSLTQINWVQKHEPTHHVCYLASIERHQQIYNQLM